jgi:flagellar biosynthesis chaperone FliJ
MGPTPHVIKTTSEIKIQRLEKKIRKLTEQRDHYKAQNADLTRMLQLYPYIMNRWEDYKKRQADSQRLRDYDKLVPLLENENDHLKAQIQILTSISGAKD